MNTVLHGAQLYGGRRHMAVHLSGPKSRKDKKSGQAIPLEAHPLEILFFY